MLPYRPSNPKNPTLDAVRALHTHMDLPLKPHACTFRSMHLSWLLRATAARALPLVAAALECVGAVLEVAVVGVSLS